MEGGSNLQVVLRREEKFLLKKVEAYRYMGRIDAVLMRDPYAKNGSYPVRSLYFDTVDDKDFFEKVDEQEIRHKIRIRIYHPSDTKAKLERKQKQNLYQKKQSLTISREDAQEMAAGNYHVLLKYGSAFADEVYVILAQGVYRPKVIVEYNRLAFMAKENHIRLTFDSDIRATESNLDLFDPKLQLLPVFDPEYVVFESKYDKFMLSYIKELQGEINRTAISASKYCAGRGMSLPLWL